MNRIFTVVNKDLLAARRDRMTSYFFLAPFLLALAARLALPLLEGVPLRFAAGPALPAALVASLERHGELERLDDEPAVKARVSKSDHVPGLVAGPAGEVRVLLEGNEPDYVANIAALLIDLEAHRAKGGALPVIVEDSLGEPRPLLAAMSAALLGFAVLGIVGLVLGFTILEEKESGTQRLTAVSPLTFREYALAKAGLGAALAIPSALVAMWVLVGPANVPLGPALVALVAALPIALSLGLLVGTFAKDQLGAIALLKGLMTLWLSVPAVGFAVEGPWRLALAPLPNHHAVQALFGALTGQAFQKPAASAFGLGALVLAAVLFALRRRMQLGAFA